MAKSLKKAPAKKWVPNKCEYKGCKCKGKSDAWYSATIDGKQVHYCADARGDRRQAQAKAGQERMKVIRAKQAEAAKKKTLTKKEK